jgi:hypothetical protein
VLGTTAILHTFGENLSLHPHLHCVVTGGALSTDGQRFVSTRKKGFLFPVRALAKVFRGKYLEGLRWAFDRIPEYGPTSQRLRSSRPIGITADERRG